MKRELRLVVGVTGASGAPVAVWVLKQLAEIPRLETHLVMTRMGRYQIELECPETVDKVRALADVVHQPTDMGASISSGSFLTDGMIVAPCSSNTLSAVATGREDNLVQRAAGVTLKEHRPLVMGFREMPLSAVHVRNMLTLAEMGVTFVPLMLTFYDRFTSLAENVRHIGVRMLDQVGLPDEGVPRWQGALAAHRHNGAVT